MLLPADNSAAQFPLLSGSYSAWLQRSLHGIDGSNSIALVLEVRGRIDPDVFRKTISVVVADCDLLRLRLHYDGRQPTQSVLASDDYAPLIADLSMEPDPRSAAAKWVEKTAKAIRLVEGQRLYEFALLKLADELWHIMIAMHHATADGWTGIVGSERVAAVYTALALNREIPPNPWGSFREVVMAEQRYRDSAQYSKDRSFWVGQLSDWEGLGTLTTVSTPVVSHETFHQSQRVPDELFQRLQHFAVQQHCALSELLTLSVSLYIARMTSRWDVVLSMPFTGRIGEISRETPGLLMNVLPFRLKFQPESTVAENLSQVRRMFRAAMRHQRFRGEDLRNLVGLSSATLHGFGPNINLQLFPTKLIFGEAEATYKISSSGFVEDIMFSFSQGTEDAGLHLHIDANTGLYEPAELSLHGGRLLDFIHQLIADPLQKLDEIELLPAEERELTTQLWNGRDADVSQAPWHSLVEARARQAPGKVAACFRGECLTFKELDERSSQLARHLRTLGVDRNRIVALLVPRSLDMLVAMLGISKAGGAYLPLDEEYPEDLIRLMVEDAAPLCIVTSSDAAGGLAGNPLPQVLLDRDWPLIAAQSSDSLSCAIRPEDTAYVSYTSGTSGRPKAIVVRHQGLSNLVSAEQAILGITEDSTFLSFASLSFDASFSQIGTPLCAGAKLVICPREDRAGWRLAHLMDESGVTHAEIPPAVLASLPEEVTLKTPNLIVSGEACMTSVVERWATGRRLFNAYGPAEATVTTTIGLLGKGRPITIGRPLQNIQVYVLDAKLRPLPIGATGEIFIGGIGLAAGYLNRPDLTDERFIANPFGPADSRLYQTGDLARWKLDGELEFLGRADSQIKIRGLRVELGGIEKALETYPDIVQAAVTAIDDRSGMKALAAYVVLRSGATLTNAQMRRFLGRVLPQSMIPGSFTVLDKLPLTSSGKVDRRSLPAPLLIAKTFESPGTRIEQIVCEEIARLLQIERVGLNDNFFDLGGNSLSGMQLLEKLQQALTIRIPLSNLFLAETIQELCSLVASAAEHQDVAGPAKTKLITLNNGDRDSPTVVLIHGVNGSFRSFRHLTGYLPMDQTILAFQYTDPVEGEDLSAWFAETSRALFRMLTTMRPAGPYRLIGHCVGGVLAYELACDLLANHEDVDFVGLLDTHSRDYPMRISSRLIRKKEHLVDQLNQLRREGGLHKYLEVVKNSLRNAWMEPPRRRRSGGSNHVNEFKGVPVRTAYSTRRLGTMLHLFIAVGSESQHNAPADYGWSSCVGSNLKIERVSGDHLTMLEPQYVAGLANSLTPYLRAPRKAMTVASPDLNEIRG